MEDLQALSYFSSLTHISRKVAFQEKSLIKYLGNKWTEYSPEQREELLNDLCVPHFIRDEQPSVADDDDNKPPLCWPTLKLPSGEKIIVDENDIWTWRDEHSGPFSWKSRSQQDLTLLDLETENLMKPYGKRHKISESDDQTAPVSPVTQKQFVPNHESWTQAVLEDYFANCVVEVQTPAHTPTSAQSPVESPSEEVNAGFEGSVEDLSPSATPAHTAAPQREDGSSVSKTEIQTPKAKPRGHKTPSPKKLPHAGIIKKDNREDTSQQLLIIDNRDEEKHAFTNPAMEVEWSNFVGQSSTDPEDEISIDVNPEDQNKPSSSSSKGQRQSPVVVKEPAAMMMDRGGVGSGGEESVEGTPDHTTQLLKSSSGTTAGVEEAEKEEVVYVVEDGAGSVSVSSTVVASSNPLDMNILRSGFDFLDNW